MSAARSNHDLTSGVPRGERLRLAVGFFVLGLVPIAVGVRLFRLQVIGGHELSRGVNADGSARAPLVLSAAVIEGRKTRTQGLAAPRGTILDRHGRALARDQQTFEVRLEVTTSRAKRADSTACFEWLKETAAAVASRLAADPQFSNDPRVFTELRDRIASRLFRAFGFDSEGVRAADRPLPRRGDVFLAADVASLGAIAALRDLDTSSDYLRLHWQPQWTRRHIGREFTWSTVGYTGTQPIAWNNAGKPSAYGRHGIVGLERLAVLDPGAAGERQTYRDSLGGRLFGRMPSLPESPSEVRSTLDVELQEDAFEILQQAALNCATDAIVGKPDGKLPRWGALVLVEVATGDVVSMASWWRDGPPKGGATVESYKARASTPHQLSYEPGSVVKPLIFALAHARGALDWQRGFDCTPTMPDRARRVGPYRRIIHDDHECGVLTPHSVLVNSSNIGAVEVGMGISRELWEDYLAFYQIAKPLDLPLPYSVTGRRPVPLMNLPDKRFWKYTAPGLSIGYGMDVTALHVARAYLSLLSGRSRGLRLVESVCSSGEVHTFPPTGTESPLMIPEASVRLVVNALADVVSPTEGATGRHLFSKLQEWGVEKPERFIAGKSGTAESTVSVVDVAGEPARRVEMRNASFVGFAPVDNPRWLCVCVLQKEKTARFYGGRYAAPAVGQLLLRALRVERRLDGMRRVSLAVTRRPDASGQDGRVLETSDRQGGHD